MGTPRRRPGAIPAGRAGVGRSGAPAPLPCVHWLVYGIPPAATSLDAARATGAKEGKNSMLKTGWAGCAPPQGDIAHRYFLQLFAVDRSLDLRPGIGRSALLHAIG